MIPDINDAVLTRAIASRRMIESGEDYWQHGLVGELHHEDDGRLVRTIVKGSSPTPYRVEVRFGPGSAIRAMCSCPVGIGCKHAAATLFALRDIQAPRQLSHDRGGSGNLDSGDKWIADLTAAMLAAGRRQDEQATTPEPQPGVQGEGGIGRRERREDAGRAGAAV